MITELLALFLLRRAGENARLGVDAIAAETVPVPRTPSETVIGRAEPRETILPSPIPEVPSESWTRFAKAMQTQGLRDVSASNALGLFEMKPRRLADLGIMRGVKSKRAKNGRMVWVGQFVQPLSSQSFLNSPLAQYNAFVDSMRDYAKRALPRPDGMTLSGALAVLHRAGESGLRNWHKDSGAFKDTKALVEKVNGVF